MPDVNVNNSPVKLIFSCCGAADVGEIADLATRRVHKEGAGKMYCLTGIGAGLQSFIDMTNGAAKVVAVDGCAVDCTKNYWKSRVSPHLNICG